jgi:hypothetical protein
MNVHAELRSVWRLYRILRRRHAQLVDELGFGYSRTDNDPTGPAPVPDGVDLYFLTGRARQEATR